jgi:PPOX class probable F420-dependent enzyme
VARRDVDCLWRWRGFALLVGDSPRIGAGMTDDGARRRLAAARVGRLASIDEHGRPHVVPICFAVSGDQLVSVVDHKPKRNKQLRRLENLRHNPAVQLIVDHYDDDWSVLWWVRVSGQGRVVEHGATRDDAIEHLVSKYPQYREHRPNGAVVLIDITDISSWQATPE